MGSRQTEAVLQSLCRLAAAQAAELTDGQLLSRFAADRDETAFATLLQRHGSLVYRVCLNILRHPHDAEDAFQGTFLVLARRAGAIREEKALGSWLYRIAYRVAMRARKAAERRRAQEARAAKPAEDRPAGELAWRELQAILDEELNRLPEKYRLPFVLCCLSGKSKSEAAAELGWKEGTVSSRLAHARELLQSRLARRGVALSALLTGLSISEGGAAAAVPAALAAATREAAVAFANGGTATTSAAELARDVLRGLALPRLAVASAVVALVALAGVGAALALHQPQDAPTPEPVRAVAVAPPEPAGDGIDAPAGPRMRVEGRVTGPDGKAVPNARVAIAAVPARRGGGLLPAPFFMHVLGEGRADDQGNFRLSVAQATAGHHRLNAIATAPGFAMGSNMADPANVTADSHTLPLQLPRGHTVRVRLLDPAGKPAKGVKPHLLGLRREGEDGVLVLYYDPPVTIPGWPETNLTDDAGQFTLRDIGPDTQVRLQVRDERYATQWLQFQTANEERAEPYDLTLAPARPLEGVVTANDSGQPMANVTVLVQSLSTLGTVQATTDREGRFLVRPFPGDKLTVWAYPAAELPYLVVHQEVEWPAGADRHRVDLVVPRGVLVRGAVREAGTARPLGGTSVRYEPRWKDNPLREGRNELARAGIQWKTRDALTDADGSFYIAVPPGPGTLMVKAAEPDFIHVETSNEQLDGYGKGGRPFFANALVPVSPQPGSAVLHPTIDLRRGVTLRGRLLGPDGKPAPASALLYSPTYIPEGIEVKPHPLPVRDGRFELPGCEPGAKVGLWFYDPRAKTGAVAVVKVEAGAEPEVRLAPCVSARVHIADAGGRPVAGARIVNYLAFRPGPDMNEARRLRTDAELTVPMIHVCGRDYAAVEQPGGDYLLPDLIPGAAYTVYAEGKNSWLGQVTVTAPPPGTTVPAIAAINGRAPPPPRK